MNRKKYFDRNLILTIALGWPCVLWFSLLPLPVWADIYKCQGDSGIPAFVDDKTKRSGNYQNCVLYMRADNQPVTPGKANRSTTTSSQNSGGQDFPRIDGQTQSKMDSKRKQILQEELGSEQQALEESKKQLQEAQLEQKQKPGNAINDRLARLQKEIDGHLNNIRLLEKELSSVNSAGK